MNWFDLLLLGILILYLISGFVQGLAKQIFNLFGFVIVMALAFLGSRFLGGYAAAYINPAWLIPYQDVARLLGAESAAERAVELVAGVAVFLVLVVVLSIVFRLFSGGLKQVNKVPVLGFFNRLGGAALGLLVGIFFSYIVLNAVSLVPVQLCVDAVAGSYLAGAAELYLPPVTAWLKEVLLHFYLSAVQNSGS
ncbi:MAG: CvpA family protein [Bacillota bacterium]